ncbi:MAG: ComEA family DNA-binding protein [Myxococcales bacterium]|nr:ComEA family DNA-binding protein [Myxococcales bacterium]
MLPRAAPAVPRRVVHVAGLGWVDAEAVVGLPATAGDGEAWALRRVDEAPSRGVELAPTEVTAAPSALALGARLSLNGATAEELEVLPGIGPALAARIVAARPFATVAALDRVRGIGPRTYARLAPLLDL